MRSCCVSRFRDRAWWLRRLLPICLTLVVTGCGTGRALPVRTIIPTAAFYLVPGESVRIGQTGAILAFVEYDPVSVVLEHGLEGEEPTRFSMSSVVPRQDSINGFSIRGDRFPRRDTLVNGQLISLMTVVPFPSPTATAAGLKDYTIMMMVTLP
jgi:hypothetical protein